MVEEEFLGGLFFMKRLIGLAAVIVALSLSGSVFAQDLTFELNGKKYEVAPQILYDGYTWESAKVACDEFVNNSKNDWFLPSKEELTAMHEQLYKKGLGGFIGNYVNCWSSTEKDELNAWTWFFVSKDDNKTYDSSICIDVDKSCLRVVRCVRVL